MRLAAVLATLAVLSAGPAWADCPLDRWETILNPGPQAPEQIDPGAPDVIAFRFDELAGPYAKLFAFFRYDGTCFTKALLAGSYEKTTLISRETGQIKPHQRIYHLDLYDQDGHRTLGLSETPYTLDQVRTHAQEHLK